LKHDETMGCRCCESLDKVNALTVDRIAVRYGDNLALDDFSLEVPPGQIMAVVGPSGSGKSTLLRAIAGLEPLVTGRIVLGDSDLAGVATHRRNLGLMFQDHGLFTHLSVADNIGYGLKTAGVDGATRRSRVSDLLDLVGLASFGGRATNELSGGEAQRVALARALAPQPGLLMLDEPLGSLDRALRDQLTGELRRLLTTLGQTALHVTHDQAEAFALADRVAVVADGRLVAVGTPSELWSNPKQRFVAEFLGHPNIWTVAVDDGGAVSWNGRPLGQLSSDHPLRQAPAGQTDAVMRGPGLTVAPTEPTRSGDGPGLDVVVSESVFRAGMHDVVATVPEPSKGSADNEATVHFTTAQVVSPGQRLTLAVNIEELVPLDD
jgi:thiamine transport system ATP-binding protein